MAFPPDIPPRRDAAWTAELLQIPISFSIFMAGKPCVHVHNNNGNRDYAGQSDTDNTCLEVLHAANFVTQHPADLHNVDLWQLTTQYWDLQRVRRMAEI